MMIALGNFFFRYRNGLFILGYGTLAFGRRHLLENSWTAALIGLAVIASGQLIRALAVGLKYIKRGGKDRSVYADHLVQEGMFAHSRNPLYLGNILILIGLGFVSNRLFFFATGLPFFLLAYYAIIRAEESYLHKKFGAEFEDYCRRVNRIIPSLSGWGETWRSMKFNWGRLVTKEYGSAFLWMAGAVALMGRNLWEVRGLSFDRIETWILLAALFMATAVFATARILKKTQVLRA